MICNQYTLNSNKNKILIGIAGAPSSGKDKMAEALSAALTNKSEKVPEEARKYIQENGKLYSIFQQNIIYHRQKELEEEILRNYDVAVSSSPIFLAQFYAVLLKQDGILSAELSTMADLYRKAIESLVSYDYIMLCAPLESYDQDDIRYQNTKQVDTIHRSIAAFLDLHGKNYLLLPSATVNERLKMCLEYIGATKVVKKTLDQQEGKEPSN